MFIDNLEHIEVARNDISLNSLLLGGTSKGADNVISLVIVEFVKRDVKGVEELHQIWDLGVEVGRSGFAIGLVVWIKFAAAADVGF